MDKLKLKTKSVDFGGDEEGLERMASGRRKDHFTELPSDRLLEKFTHDSPTDLGRTFSDGDFESNDSGSPTSPRVIGEEHRHRVTSIAEYEDEVFFTANFDAAEVEKTCVVAFVTVNNIRETTGDTVKQQLRDYIQRVFRMSKSRVEVLTEIANSEESPEMKLVCKVMHARALTAKDANGKSDPYCRIGILNQEHLESHLVKHKDLVHWKKEGWVDKVLTTSIKLATLDPDWNEEFELHVTDTVQDVFVLEIWDSDDEEIQKASQAKGQGKGVKNLTNFLTDLRKGVDDFMGRCFHPLQSIPVGGEVKTFVLRSHSGKSKHGFISLSFNFRGVKENTPLEVSIWEHTMLTRAMVNESSRVGNTYVRHWDANFPKEAEKLLEQHATLNGLNKLQQVAIRLSVLIKYHKLYAVSVSTLRALLRDIKEHKALLPRTLTPEDIKKGGDKSIEWIVQLFSDLLEISTDIEEIFRNHLNLFSLQREKHVKKLEDNLMIIRQLYSFRPFVYQLPPEKRNLKDVLEDCIREATRSWFSVLGARLQPTVRSSQSSKLESLNDLCENCLCFSKSVMKQLGPMFMEEGVSYFTHFYVTMENLLGAKVETTLKAIEASPDTATPTFEIYITLRQLCNLTNYLDKHVELELSLSHSHSWFQPFVQKWIDQAIERCRSRISKAIELDEPVKSDEVKISTSAVDVCGFLMQVGEFLKHLEWPDPKVFFGLMVGIIQQMSDCAQLYLKELYRALGSKYNEQGQFLTSEELSVALNNMYHVRTMVKQLPEKLKLDSCYGWLEKQEAGLGQNARVMIERVLESADEDSDNRVRQIVDDTAKKLSSDILKSIKDVIAAPEGTDDNKAVGPLLNYLAVNLQTLGDCTYSEVFSRILLPIWRVSVEAVTTTLSELSGKKTAANLPLATQRLMATLDLLRLFLHADGNGLSFEEMDSDDAYKDALSDLKVLKFQSDELTLQFFSDLAALQSSKEQSGQKDLGELLLTVGYSKEKGALHAHVIQGRGLPAMDKDGSSDPYVQLTVLPQWKYTEANKKVYKTQVEKGTLDPYFNKEFSIPIPSDQMSVDGGGILLLTVFDHDIITANDFTGMCVVPLTSVPSSASDHTPSSTEQQRRNLTLPLFVLSEQTKSKSLVELGNRLNRGDAKAAGFFKTNKKILGNLKKLVREPSRSSLF